MSAWKRSAGGDAEVMWVEYNGTDRLAELSLEIDRDLTPLLRLRLTDDDAVSVNFAPDIARDLANELLRMADLVDQPPVDREFTVAEDAYPKMFGESWDEYARRVLATEVPWTVCTGWTVMCGNGTRSKWLYSSPPPTPNSVTITYTESQRTDQPKEQTP